jgi:hypothetical protein
MPAPAEVARAARWSQNVDKLRLPRARIEAWLQAFAAHPRAPRAASWIGVAVLLVLVARFGRDAGITFDEEFQREYGERVLAWYRSGFTDRGAMHYLDLYLYGGLFDLCAQWLVGHSPLEQYETRHLLTALLAVLGVVGTSRMAARVGGAWAGFFAGLMLVLSPTWLGHGLFNPKDIPFAVAAVFVSNAAVGLALGPALPRWRTCAWAGLTVGLALAVRPGGVFLFAYPLLAGAARASLELWRRSRAGEPLNAGTLFASLCARAVLLVCIAWLAMLSAWPWAQLSPLKHPIEAIAAASHFSYSGEMLFRGAFVHSHALPRSYLPVWFAITVSEACLLGLSCALVAAVRALRRGAREPERVLGIGAIVVSVLLPLTAVLVLRPVMYDGQRHFLFMFPPLAALAGIGLAALLGAVGVPLWLRAATAAAFLFFACQAVIDMIKLHPYEYAYFNRSSGGLRGAFGRYETDYWGVSYKEGLEWVVKELAPADPADHSERLRITTCDLYTIRRLRYYVATWPGVAERVEVVRHYGQAHVYLGVTRERCHEVPGEVVHQVKRQRVPLLYVIRTPRRL